MEGWGTSAPTLLFPHPHWEFIVTVCQGLMSSLSHRLTMREEGGESPAWRKFARAFGPCPRVILFPKFPFACSQERGPPARGGRAGPATVTVPGSETTRNTQRDGAGREGRISTAPDRTDSVRQSGIQILREGNPKTQET